MSHLSPPLLVALYPHTVPLGEAFGVPGQLRGFNPISCRRCSSGFDRHREEWLSYGCGQQVRLSAPLVPSWMGHPDRVVDIPIPAGHQWGRLLPGAAKRCPSHTSTTPRLAGWCWVLGDPPQDNARCSRSAPGSFFFAFCSGTLAPSEA